VSETNTPFFWFVVGFAASREGFNGECPYPHLAPASAFDNYMGRESIDELLRDEPLIAELSRLFESAGGRK